MVNDQPSTNRPATAGWVTATALVVIALALATLAAAAVWDTWFAADPAPVAVELVGPVAVARDFDVLRVVVEPLLVYQCLQTRAGEIDEEFLGECNEEAGMVVGRLEELAGAAGTP
jgi:hypothetical protein